MNKIGFTSVTFRNKSIDGIIEIAKKNNCNIIEWGADVHIKPGDYKTAEYVVEECKKNKISITSYGSYYWIGDHDYNAFEELCKTAFCLKTNTIRVWLGRKSSNITSKKEYNEYVDETKALCKIASKYNITIATEFHKNTYNDNAEAFLTFRKNCNCDNLMSYWQPFSINIDDDINNLKQIIDYCSTIHIFNWNENEERFSLREGMNKWIEFLKIYKVKNTNCNLILEFVKDDNESYFYDDIKTLNEILKTIQ